MKLRIDQLPAHLERHWAAIYCVAGDEPFLVDESCTHIRQAAKARGFTERRVFSVGQSNDWDALAHATAHGSLFAKGSLFEVRCHGRLAKAGQEFLKDYDKQAIATQCLLLIMGKLDSKSMQTRWFKAIDKHGVVISIAALSLYQFRQWALKRIQSAGLQFEQTALALFLERQTGNLTACAQDIEKLRLMTEGSQQPITQTTIRATIGDNATFTLFELVDSLLRGQHTSIMHMLDKLRQQGTEPILILWAISRQLRECATLAFAVRHGQSISQALNDQRVWSSKKKLLTQALSHYSLAHWHACLNQAARLDLIIKGVEPGAVWDEIVSLCYQIAGRPIWAYKQTECL